MLTRTSLAMTIFLTMSASSMANEGTPAADKPADTPKASEPAKEAKDAAAASSTAVSGTDFSCTMDKAKRTIRVAYEKEGSKVPCKVNYVRDAASGEEKVLYSAAAQEGYCEQKASEFVEKLKSTGWTCSAP